MFYHQEMLILCLLSWVAGVPVAGQVTPPANVQQDSHPQSQIENSLRVLSNQPDNIEARKALASAYEKSGDLAHARIQLEILHSGHPSDLTFALQLANLYIQMGRESQALDVLLPYESEHKTDMALEYSLAFAQIQSGHDTDGIPRMERVARATRSASAWVIIGATRLHQGKFAEAKTALDSAIALNPSLPGVQTMAGQARFALGDPDAAVTFFQAGLRANPEDFDANLYTGMYWLTKGEFQSARPLLEMAYHLQPSSPIARLKRAELDRMTGNDAEAVKSLEELEKAQPDWPEPHIQLAPLYYKLHRPEDGQRERQIVDAIEARQQKSGPPKE